MRGSEFICIATLRRMDFNQDFNESSLMGVVQGDDLTPFLHIDTLGIKTASVESSPRNSAGLAQTDWRIDIQLSDL